MKRRLFIITILLLALLGCLFGARPLRAKWLLYSATKRTNTIYAAYRPFSYRWVGTPFKQIAGTGNCVPAPQNQINRLLLDIGRLEQFSGQTSATLQLRGRAGLLSCHSEDSIRTYKLALLLDPQSPNLELELGIAYALDASEDRAIQFEAALEHTLKAGRLKQTREFLFDSALLFQQAQLPIQAEQQWKEAEREAPSSVWDDEIHQRLAAVRAALQARSQKITALSSPDSFLAANDTMQREGEETALSAATSLWLSDSGKNAKPLQHLAQILKRDHGDHWLTDLMSEKSSQPTDSALRQLTQAVRFNLKGEHRNAAKAAQSAEGLFKAAESSAGSLRSRLELVYSLDRRAEADACLAALGDLESEALRRRYIWIAAQARLEHITCLTRTRKVDVIQSRNQAYAWVLSTGYQGLSLRALGFLTEPYVAADGRLTVWRRDQQGLRTFWQQPLPALRGYSFFYTLADSAQKAGDVQAAVVILRESTLLLEGSGLNLIRGILLSSLGQWEMQAGLKDAADQTFADMTSEFKQLQRNEIEQVWDEAEVAHAEALIASGRASEGKDLLDGLVKNSTWPDWQLNSNVRRVLIPAFGSAYLGTGDLQHACKNYLQSIAETEDKMAKIQNHAQRDEALREVESSWRGMTAVQLGLNRPLEALAVWETFRSARDPKIGSLISPNCGLAASSPGFELPEDRTVLVYAFLPTGLSAWVVAHGKIEQKQLDTTGVKADVERLSMLVSDQNSSPEEISSLSKHLYDLLLAPFADILPPSGTLVIDPDGELAAVPWNVLENKRGHPLIEKFSLAQVIGILNLRTSAADAGLKHALVFGPPVLSKDLTYKYPFPHEAAEEAETLHRLLPNSVFFEKEEANLQTLKAHISRISLFHFAGHTVGNGGLSVLLVPQARGSPPERQYVAAQQISELDFRRIRTVVLASCSSGTGEQRGTVNLDGLTRAFLEAGAQRVVAAGWDVNSAGTEELMTIFYEGLRNGKSPAKALRQAELEVRLRTPHPYYWAGFRLFGEP